jgi:hypothetical protein
MPEAVWQAVFQRDGGRCQAAVRGYHPEVRCKGKLHAHHHVLRSQGGRDIPEHLLMVCSLHHHYIHSVDRAGAEDVGLITRQAAVSPE